MKIERPWAAQGDYFEIMVPGPEDLEAASARIRDAPVDMGAAQRYIVERYAKRYSALGHERARHPYDEIPDDQALTLLALGL